jgi:CheY-like chemotaxis protein
MAPPKLSYKSSRMTIVRELSLEESEKLRGIPLSFGMARPKLPSNGQAAGKSSRKFRVLTAYADCPMIRITAPRVLIVDDEVQLAEVCRAVLQNAGAKAKVIYDGADAEQAIASFSPDVIVSDIKMPEVRGDELLVQLRDHGYQTPVIIITGLDRSKISIPRESPNLFALLYKPIEYDQLVRTVQNALNLLEAQQVNRLLLQKLHAETGKDVDFETWQENALATVHGEINKRRAS